jgi:hypothetical protein
VLLEQLIESFDCASLLGSLNPLVILIAFGSVFEASLESSDKLIDVDGRVSV